MTSKPPTELDVVELTVPVGIWRAGTVATVLEVFPSGRMLVEIADDRGHTLELPSVPPEAVRRLPVVDQARLAV